MVAKQLAKHFSYQQFLPSHVLKSAVLLCLENDEDRCDKYTDKEIDKEQLAYWVQRLMERVLCFILQDYVPSTFMPTLVRPVCIFEESFKFSYRRLSQYKLTYKDLSRPTFFDENQENIANDDQLKNILRAYISSHLMYWSTMPKDSKLELHSPHFDPDEKSSYRIYFNGNQ